MEKMEMESIHHLNYWLIHKLEPICDADPIVLAKYVIALIKKDKPEKNLRQKCLKQLEIFLGNETSSFVDSLFDSIKNKTYLNSTVPKSLSSSTSSSAAPSSSTSSSKASKSSASRVDSGQAVVSGDKSRSVSNEQTTRSKKSHSYPAGSGQSNSKSVGQKHGIKSSSKMEDPSLLISTSSGDGQGNKSYPNSSTSVVGQSKSSDVNSGGFATVASSDNVSVITPSKAESIVPSDSTTYPGMVSSLSSSGTMVSTSVASSSEITKSAPSSLSLSFKNPSFTSAHVSFTDVQHSNNSANVGLSAVTTSAHLVSGTGQCISGKDLGSVSVTTGSSVTSTEQQQCSTSLSHSGSTSANSRPSSGGAIRSYVRHSSSRSCSKSSYCSTTTYGSDEDNGSRSRSRSSNSSRSQSDDRSSNESDDSRSTSRSGNSRSKSRSYRHGSSSYSSKRKSSKSTSHAPSSSSSSRNNRFDRNNSGVNVGSSATAPKGVKLDSQSYRSHHSRSSSSRNHGQPSGSTGYRHSGSSSSHGSRHPQSRNYSRNTNDSSSSYSRFNSHHQRGGGMKRGSRDSRRNYTPYDRQSHQHKRGSNRSGLNMDYHPTSTHYDSNVESTMIRSNRTERDLIGSGSNSVSIPCSSTGVSVASSSTMVDKDCKFVTTSALNEHDAGSGNTVVAPSTSTANTQQTATHDCPNMVEKGFCEKGQYCLYNLDNANVVSGGAASSSSTDQLLLGSSGDNGQDSSMNPYYVEPYNPESATVDSSILMQLLPNYLINNNRFGLNSSEIGSSTGPTSGANADGPNNSKTSENISDNPNDMTLSSGGGNFLKMLKKPLNYGGQVRPRELVGVSLEGGDTFSDQSGANGSGTNSMQDTGYKNNNQRSYRWSHHHYRNSNNKRGNNIDILAASSTNESGRYSNYNITALNVDCDMGTNYPAMNLETNESLDQTNFVSTENDESGPPGEKPMVLPISNSAKQTSSKLVSDKTMLVIRKIPPRLNTIGALNKHFSKYGTVVYIQVCHENDPQSALVQFSNSFEATAAIRSIEAVFNNRFIKVYWAKNSQAQSQNGFRSNSNFGGAIKRKSSDNGNANEQYNMSNVNESSNSHQNFSIVNPSSVNYGKKAKIKNNSSWYNASVGAQSTDISENVDHSGIDSEGAQSSNRHPPTTDVSVSSNSDNPKKFKKIYADNHGVNVSNSNLSVSNNEPGSSLSFNVANKPTPIKTISHSERAKQMKLLSAKNQSLQDALANQKHLMQKLEKAKTPKEKAAIMKLLQVTMKNVDDIKQGILKIQAIIQPSLRTTKINNNNSSNGNNNRGSVSTRTDITTTVDNNELTHESPVDQVTINDDAKAQSTLDSNDDDNKQEQLCDDDLTNINTVGTSETEKI